MMNEVTFYGHLLLLLYKKRIFFLGLKKYLSRVKSVN